MKDYPYVPGWRQNKENNKPAIKHSVLMLTTHGVAEGEWYGNEWVQYRWSCKIKDSDVLYWMHLEDLTQLEKEGQTSQQEQPNDLASLISEAITVAKRIVDRDSFYNSLPQNLRNKYTSEEWYEILEALSMMKVQEQPEVDLDKFTEKIDAYMARYKYPESVSIRGAMAFTARMFYQYPNAARQWYENLPKATMD